MYVTIVPFTDSTGTGYDYCREFGGELWYLASWGEWLKRRPLFPARRRYDHVIELITRYPFVRPIVTVQPVPYLQRIDSTQKWYALAIFNNQTRYLMNDGWGLTAARSCRLFENKSVAQREAMKIGLPAYNHLGFI